MFLADDLSVVLVGDGIKLALDMLVIIMYLFWGVRLVSWLLSRGLMAKGKMRPTPKGVNFMVADARREMIRRRVAYPYIVVNLMILFVVIFIVNRFVNSNEMRTSFYAFSVVVVLGMTMIWFGKNLNKKSLDAFKKAGL